MNYNPFVEAAKVLVSDRAVQFYKDTAIEHTFLAVAVASIAINNTIEAGKAFREIHDSAIVPFTLMAIATVIEFFAEPEPEQASLPPVPCAGLLVAGVDDENEDGDDEDAVVTGTEVVKEVSRKTIEEELGAMSLEEVRRVAVHCQIVGWTKMKKPRLIEAIADKIAC